MRANKKAIDDFIFFFGLFEQEDFPRGLPQTAEATKLSPENPTISHSKVKVSKQYRHHARRPVSLTRERAILLNDNI
jgi:hypothetical protein